MSVPFKFHTAFGAAEAEVNTKLLLEVIQRPVLYAGLQQPEVNLDATFPMSTITDPYPIVVILNGVGTNGKSTFASMVAQYASEPVYEISTIDPLRPVAYDIIATHVDQYKNLYAETPKLAATHEAEKSDEYRSLLHDLKVAWDHFGDGPNMYCLGKLITLIDPSSNRDLSTVEAKTQETPPLPSIIFVNIREEDNINKFRTYCHEMGLICFSLLIDGNTAPEAFSNEGDAKVNTFSYDLTIPNKGSIDDLSVMAFIFATFAVRANKMYGISRSESEKILLDRKKQEIVDKFLNTDITTTTTTTPVETVVDTNTPDTTTSAESEEVSAESPGTFCDEDGTAGVCGSNEHQSES